jgi:hypothetical protein
MREHIHTLPVQLSDPIIYFLQGRGVVDDGGQNFVLRPLYVYSEV